MGNLLPTSWSDAASKLFNPLDPNVGPMAVLNGATDKVDLSGVNKAQGNAFGVSAALGDQYATAAKHGAYNPAEAQTLYNQGQGAIGNLQQAAAGAVPSAAEIQLHQQAAQNAARGYGAAAALQGRSPGMALRQAALGGAGIQAQTNADAAGLRANEMANARGQLVQAVQGQQGVLGDLRGTDIMRENGLLAARGNALNAGVAAASANANAQAQAAAGKNAMKGGVLQGLVGAIL